MERKVFICSNVRLKRMTNIGSLNNWISLIYGGLHKKFKNQNSGCGAMTQNVSSKKPSETRKLFISIK